MDKLVRKMEKKVQKNEIVLEELSDLDQDMKKYLEPKASIKYIRCRNLLVTIGSKINHIILKKCNNIILKLTGLISGIEIEESDNISITSEEDVGSVIISKSNEIHLNTDISYIDIYQSKNIKYD